MHVISLPPQPSIEQLRKRAREFQRAVRAGQPLPLELVAEHSPGPVDPESFTLARAQLVLARCHGFTSWPQLLRHLGTAPAGPRPTAGDGSLTTDNRYRVHRGWVSADDTARCAGIATAAHPDPAGWRPVLTAQYNGVHAVVFSTPVGPLFGELTPATVTLSGSLVMKDAPAVLFRTGCGTIAGITPPGTARVTVGRPADRDARQAAVLAGDMFAAPNAFKVDDTGLVLWVDEARRGLIVPLDALPGLAHSVNDRPTPAGDRDSPAGLRLAAALAMADVPPVADADAWTPGAYAELPGGESIQLGSYRQLLLWHKAGEEPFVFDFSRKRGPVVDFAVTGKTVALTRVYYGFSDGSSDRVVLAGLADRALAGSVVLRRADGTELPAVLAGGTALITAPGLTAPRERGTVTDRIVVRDAAGTVVEDLPYQQQP